MSLRKYLAPWVTIAFIVATPAFAADIPVWSKTNAPARYLPVTASRPYSWTGCYLGLEGGGAWGQSQHSAASPPMVDLPITQDFNVGSGIFGGTIGCNYQTGDTAFGVENDLSWTNVKGTGNDILPFAVGGTSSTNEKWLDTLRGRIGYARDQIFVYGTGGAAFANVGVEVCVPAGFCASDSDTDRLGCRRRRRMGRAGRRTLEHDAQGRVPAHRSRHWPVPQSGSRDPYWRNAHHAKRQNSPTISSALE